MTAAEHHCDASGGEITAELGGRGAVALIGADR